MVKLPKINFKRILKNISEFSKNIIRKKEFKKGTDAIIFIVSVIGIVVFINVLLARYNFRYDTTENKQYSLSNQTKKVLKNLDKKVKVLAFIKKGSYYEKQIKDLLHEYTQRTKKLDAEYIDPDKEPALASTYGIREYNTVVFESGLKRKSISQKELFTVDYYSQSQQATFFGEEYFTNAIITVTQETSQKSVYFLEGHKERDIDNNEREGMSEIKKALEMDNYSIRKINIAKEGKIPDDCGVLVIASPGSVVVDEELNILQKYLDKGGKMFVLLDPLISTRLEYLLNKWKVDVHNDLVFDPQACYFFDPRAPIPRYMGHDITKDLEKNKVAMVLPGAKSFAETKEKKEGVSVSNLLQTTSYGSWGERDFKSRKPEYNKDIDTEPPLTLALAVTYWIKQKKEGEKEIEPIEMRLVVVGDSDFASNKAVQIQGNLDFFVNSVNWLAKEKDKISIRAKSSEIKRIDLSKGKSKFIFYTSVIITPLLVLCAGIYVWIRRRKL